MVGRVGSVGTFGGRFWVGKNSSKFKPGACELGEASRSWRPSRQEQGIFQVFFPGGRGRTSRSEFVFSPFFQARLSHTQSHSGRLQLLPMMNDICRPAFNTKPKKRKMDSFCFYCHSFISRSYLAHFDLGPRSAGADTPAGLGRCHCGRRLSRARRRGSTRPQT